METIRSRLKNLLAIFGTTPLEDLEMLPDTHKLAPRSIYRMKLCRKYEAGDRCQRCKQRIAKGTINREIGTLNHMQNLASQKPFKMRWDRQVNERVEWGGRTVEARTLRDG